MSRSRRAARAGRGRLAARLAVVVPLGLLAAYGAGGSAASALPTNCSRSGGTITCTFGETGAPVTWTVPAGLTSATLTLYGGSGGAGGTVVATGGAGAEVTGTVSLAGISALTLNVAGVGGSATKTGTGGYGGGGAGGDGGHTGSGGGGATTVSDSGGTLLIAGGGGGGGANGPFPNGGAGGNADTVGQSGRGVSDAGATAAGGGGGGPGTQTAGGAGGSGGGATSSSTCSASGEGPGNPGSSGQGGGDPPGNAAGGGGGGGFFGGGQGGDAGTINSPCDEDAGRGGGGGGSSFTGGQGISGAVVNDDPSAPAALGGNGEVLISYIVDGDLAIASHPNITTKAAGPSGAVVSFTAPAVTDPDDTSPPSASCTPASGSTFAVGTTTVTCTATDSDDSPSTASTSFTVTVVDSDLAIASHPDITTNATGPSGAVVTYTAPAVTDPDDGSAPAAVCTPKSGSTFAIGTTTVTCTGTDTDDANSPVSSFTVTVKGAAAQLADLYQAVRGTGLASTVAAAQREVAAGQTQLACVMLRMFEVEAEAEVPFAISPGTAATLVADATRIRAVLGCSSGSLF